MTKILIKRLFKNVQIPKYETEGSSGLDLAAKLDKDVNIRYIIDYRKFNHNILCKFCSILEEFELDTIYAVQEKLGGLDEFATVL